MTQIHPEARECLASQHDELSSEWMAETIRIGNFECPYDPVFISLKAVSNALYQRDEARAKLAQAVEVMKPFEIAYRQDFTGFPDDAAWDDDTKLTVGNLRAAAKFVKENEK